MLHPIQRNVTSLPAVERIDDRGDRRTVIPTPRSNGMFSGWGPRF